MEEERQVIVLWLSLQYSIYLGLSLLIRDIAPENALCLYTFKFRW